MGRPKTWTRQDVLARATRLFWEKGYAGSHLGELVRTTGLNRFALYKEFGGKEGLFLEALRGYVKDLEELGRVLAREPRGLANIRDFFRAVDEYGFHHGCFVLNTVREKSVVGKDAWRLTREFVLAGEQALRANLAAAKAKGEIRRDVDVEAMARFLVALNIGLIEYGVVAPDGTDKTGALRILDGLLG